MSNLIDLVGRLSASFQRLQLRFAIGGAIANNYWGVVRTTQDIDCLIAIPAIKFQVFADELTTLGCRFRDAASQETGITVTEILSQTRNRKFVECFCDNVRVELFVPAVPLQEEILRRAVTVDLGGYQVPITTAEDLILVKIAFHRVKDILDVRGILWVQREQLDFDYLRTWSARSLEAQSQAELENLIHTYCVTE